jgi:dienelactone hydrolase
LSIDHLLSLATCNGRIGATGMCLGGHLAFRCALDPRINSAITYFATDVHSSTLGAGKSDDSLKRAAKGDLNHAELVLIFGKKDNHVPPEGRDLIRKTLHEAGATFGWYEVAWAQREFLLSRFFEFAFMRSAIWPSLPAPESPCCRRPSRRLLPLYTLTPHPSVLPGVSFTPSAFCILPCISRPH